MSQQGDFDELDFYPGGVNVQQVSRSVLVCEKKLQICLVRSSNFP